MDNLLKTNKTAFYVFDVQQAASRVSFLRSMLPAGVKIIYAVKANPFITQGISDYVDGFEVCSPGETAICNELGIPAEQTVISGVYKNPEFIEELIAENNARLFTVESVAQFSLFEKLGKLYKRKIRLLLRLTNGSQFGINRGDIEQIISSAKDSDFVSVSGIQFFSGTQKISSKKIRREIAEVDGLLESLRIKCGFSPEVFEYGPGLPVNYFEGEESKEAELLCALSEALSSMKAAPKVSVELGRSITASCGCYYTHVVDLKCNSGENYALVDGGMHHIVYFGQYMGMKHPQIRVCGKEEIPASIEFNICGSLCSMNDILVKQLPLPELEIGDVLCFNNTGAYCMTEGISLFLSRELPAVYLMFKDGSLRCVREPFETYPLNMPRY